MVIRREEKRKATKDRVLSALNRLINGNTQYVAKPYKINPYTVEREADLSVGALRNYPELKSVILEAVNVNQLKPNTDGTELTIANSKNQHLEDINNLKLKIKKLKKNKQELESKLAHAETALNQQQKIEVELIMAIHSSLSSIDRQKLYESKNRN